MRKLKNHTGLYASLDELMAERSVPFRRKRAASALAGDVKSVFKGRGIEVEEIRSYAFGDDVRDMDWRVTARKDAPFTKVYHEEKDREVYVLLDLSSRMMFGTKRELKSVTASKVAALLGWTAEKNKDRFGLMIFNGATMLTYKPQQGRAHLLAILKKISHEGREMLSKKDNAVGLEKPLLTLSKLIKSKAFVFVVSDFGAFDEAEQKALAVLAKKTQVACVRIADVLEQEPPASGEYMIYDHGKTLVFQSGSRLFKNAYRKHFAHKQEALKTFCRQFKCLYLNVKTNAPVGEQMIL